MVPFIQAFPNNCLKSFLSVSGLQRNFASREWVPCKKKQNILIEKNIYCFRYGQQQIQAYFHICLSACVEWSILGADQLGRTDAWVTQRIQLYFRCDAAARRDSCLHLPERASCKNTRHFTARKQSRRKRIPYLTSLGTNRVWPQSWHHT